MKSENDELIKSEENSAFKIDKKYIIIIFIVGGAITLLITAAIIIAKIRDRKINKAFDDFDKL